MVKKNFFRLVNGLSGKRHSKPITAVFFIIIISGVLSGCSCGGSTTITGQARQSINPSEVHLFVARPLQYEIIGLVEASRAVGFSRYAARDRVISDLKQRAAEIGANGVLALHAGSRDDGVFFFRTLNTQMKALHVIKN